MRRTVLPILALALLFTSALGLRADLPPLPTPPCVPQVTC